VCVIHTHAHPRTPAHTSQPLLNGVREQGEAGTDRDTPVCLFLLSSSAPVSCICARARNKTSSKLNPKQALSVISVSASDLAGEVGEVRRRIHVI